MEKGSREILLCFKVLQYFKKGFTWPRIGGYGGYYAMHEFITKR